LTPTPAATPLPAALPLFATGWRIGSARLTQKAEIASKFVRGGLDNLSVSPAKLRALATLASGSHHCPWRVHTPSAKLHCAELFV
jgi:hypothetical protein